MMSPTFTRGARFACATTLLFTAALWFSSPALAASDGNSTPVDIKSGNSATHDSSASFSGTIVRTMIGLLVVIAVIYGLSWILKQARSSRNPSMGEGLAQVASLPLGPHRSVALVRVGAELHLLGIAEHGITSLRVFSEEDAYELGIPFEHDDFDTSAGDGGLTPTQRLMDSLRRFTVR